MKFTSKPYGIFKYIWPWKKFNELNNEINELKSKSSNLEQEISDIKKYINFKILEIINPDLDNNETLIEIEKKLEDTDQELIFGLKSFSNNIEKIKGYDALLSKNKDLLDKDHKWKLLHDGKDYDFVSKEKKDIEEYKESLHGLNANESGTALEDKLKGILEELCSINPSEISFKQKPSVVKNSSKKPDFVVEFKKDESVVFKVVIECKNTIVNNIDKKDIDKDHWKQLIDYARDGNFRMAILLTTIKYDGYQSSYPKYIRDWKDEIGIEKKDKETTHLFLANILNIRFLFLFLITINLAYKPVHQDIRKFWDDEIINDVIEKFEIIFSFWTKHLDFINTVQKNIETLYKKLGSLKDHSDKLKKFWEEHECKLESSRDHFLSVRSNILTPKNKNKELLIENSKNIKVIENNEEK